MANCNDTGLNETALVLMGISAGVTAGGFAAESNDIRNNALDKLQRKNCDMLCANDILAPGCGFATSSSYNAFSSEIGKPFWL